MNKKFSYCLNILIVSILFLGFSFQNDFVNQQKKFPKVRTAYTEKESSIKEKLTENNIKINELNILLIAYKAEKKMELYAKNKNNTTYQKIAEYDICASSGVLGPKRKEGDYQVPEGFYRINVFNPNSNFYLSLGINYPNAADLKKSDKKHPGGNIFIHGSCVTIGCLPMTDDKIKEIYVYAVQAKQSGQNNIPVYIFPYKMNADNTKKYAEIHKENTALLNFWNVLKKGFDGFEKDKKELKFTVNAKGDYVF